MLGSHSWGCHQRDKPKQLLPSPYSPQQLQEEPLICPEALYTSSINHHKLKPFPGKIQSILVPKEFFLCLQTDFSLSKLCPQDWVPLACAPCVTMAGERARAPSPVSRCVTLCHAGILLPLPG